jgi:hypothetical protein
MKKPASALALAGIFGDCASGKLAANRQGLGLVSASASLQVGEQTNCALPSRRRDFSKLRGRCLPHRKQDIVAAPKAPAAVNGDPGVLLR